MNFKKIVRKMKCLDLYPPLILILALFSMCRTRPLADCDRSNGLYYHEFMNGTTRCCKWVECPPGSEVIICKNPYTGDHCQPCISPLIQPDKSNSELVVPCYKMPDCPEFSKPDENGNCQCDLDSGYFGDLYYDCTYLKCPEGKKLTKRGNCIFTNVDPFTTESTPKVKVEHPPKDTQSVDPNSKSVNKDDPKGIDESGKNYTKVILVNSPGGCETNDQRPEKSPVPNTGQDAYSYIESFFHGMLGASVPFILFCFCFAIFFYFRWKDKRNHAAILELDHYGKKNETFSSKETKWKPLPKGNLPPQLVYPGKSEFLKFPNIIPTPYATLPLKLEVGKSIGIIHMADIPWGTGFVVGEFYFMTCLHTIYYMLHIKYDAEMEIEREISQHIDNASVSFHFNDEHSKNCNRFTFERCVPYLDLNLDVIILKIDGNINLPKPLTNFCDFDLSIQFDFFGHPHGKEKQVDQYCRIMSVTSTKVEDMTEKVKEYLIQKDHNPENFYHPYQGMLDVNSYIFTTVFVAGASGSPGIIYDTRSQSYSVGTLLSGEYPKFKPNDINFYDLDPELRVQYGPKMNSIFRNMCHKNPALCRQVFQIIPPQWNEK